MGLGVSVCSVQECWERGTLPALWVPVGSSSGATTVRSPGLGVPPFSPLYPVLGLSATWLRELPLLRPCPVPHSQSAPSWGVSPFPFLPHGKRCKVCFSFSVSGLPPPKPGWQGRRKGCEVVSSARDPGLNRLMVGRMLGSVCTCIPSRRACPLEHPENARGSAWLRWSTTWPGGQGRRPCWFTNSQGGEEAGPVGCKYHGSQRSSTTYRSQGSSPSAGCQALEARRRCVHQHATTSLRLAIIQPAPAAWELLCWAC